MAGAASSLSDDELKELDGRFEHEAAEAVVAWAVEQFHPRLCLTASMSDAVLIDLAVRVEPSVEVVFIDTGYHFPETIQTLETVQRRYGLNVRVMGPPSEPAEFWKTDPVACCSEYKVGQLDAALESKLAWMSGLRRAESPTRSQAPVVSRDRRGLVKVNPLATWSDDDVARYMAQHDVPVNPLVAKGYLSIGCRPCTRPVEEGEHARDGRWAGSAKTECGLHV
ncbi:MAG TPA: phosphoadenylyl-sulfate reductase [Acidimicrobiales bacterium]|nr:phosphoadenylyl-sulfate reductase [Acidimicrobiales bacterium]